MQYYAIGQKLLTISALQCRSWLRSRYGRVTVMRFSHLIVRRIIDFCSAAI
jgi:hypothetical protein